MKRAVVYVTNLEGALIPVRASWRRTLRDWLVERLAGKSTVLINAEIYGGVTVKGPEPIVIGNTIRPGKVELV
jgi:uncharacterized membrane protein